MPVAVLEGSGKPAPRGRPLPAAAVRDHSKWPPGTWRDPRRGSHYLYEIPAVVLDSNCGSFGIQCGKATHRPQAG